MFKAPSYSPYQRPKGLTIEIEREQVRTYHSLEHQRRSSEHNSRLQFADRPTHQREVMLTCSFAATQASPMVCAGAEILLLCGLNVAPMVCAGAETLLLCGLNVAPIHRSYRTFLFQRENSQSIVLRYTWPGSWYDSVTSSGICIVMCNDVPSIEKPHAVAHLNLPERAPWLAVSNCIWQLA